MGVPLASAKGAPQPEAGFDLKANLLSRLNLVIDHGI
jgi:hypothetical protein